MINEWAVHILLECILVSQASVILSIGGVPGHGGCLVQGCLVPGGVCSVGSCHGGVPGPGGCLVLGGCLAPRGWWRHPGMATALGGMHPTGMHSSGFPLFQTDKIP